MIGIVDPESLDVWHRYYPRLSLPVQDMFAELNTIYHSPPVMFDTEGEFTTFNTRYENHPLTNMTEALAANYLLGVPGIDHVAIATDRDAQVAGVDLFYQTQHRHVPVSVKLCSVRPSHDVRHFIISNRVRLSIINDTGSEVIMFVDVRNQGIVTGDTKAVQHALAGHTDRRIGLSSTYRVFYDELGTKNFFGYDDMFGVEPTISDRLG